MKKEQYLALSRILNLKEGEHPWKKMELLVELSDTMNTAQCYPGGSLSFIASIHSITSCSNTGLIYANIFNNHELFSIVDIEFELTKLVMNYSRGDDFVEALKYLRRRYTDASLYAVLAKELKVTPVTIHVALVSIFAEYMELNKEVLEPVC